MPHPFLRRFLPAACLLALAACGGAREVAAPADSAGEAFIVAGYHPWWTRDAWRRYDPAVYDEIYFFSVEIDSSGGIAARNGWPDRWFVMQRELGSSGVRVTPVVTLFNEDVFARLFSSPSSSSRLMESLTGILRDSPATGGLQLDFELYQPVAEAVRSNLSSFVGQLRSEMDGIRPGLRLSLYLLAYDVSDVFDEAALAKHADYVVVQGYDLHGRNEGRTGPVAGLRGWGTRNWETIVGRFRDAGVPDRKIVMSVPYFGYEWPAVSDKAGARTRGGGWTIRYAYADTSVVEDSARSAIGAAEEFGLLRDEESGSAYYVYQDSSGWRQGWFEDAQSLERKYRWIVEQGLGGVAIFPPAYGTPELEALLSRYFSSPGS